MNIVATVAHQLEPPIAVPNVALKWSYLPKDGDMKHIVQMKEDILKWLKEFKSNVHSISDIVEF